MLFTESNLSKLMSPVPNERDFIWLGEYYDGTHLSEYSFDMREKNEFNMIDRNKLIRFGMIGHGTPYYFEVPGGIFKLGGTMIEVIYREGDTDYYLTGHPMMYNDIITYKDAEANANMLLHVNNSGGNGGSMKSSIFQYNIGYKAVVQYPDVKFNFQAIYVLPMRELPRLEFKLMANTTLNGKFLLKRNGSIVAEYDAPLSANKAGELNWTVI